MAIVLPSTNIGEQFGAGLNKSLGSLIENKLNAIHRTHTIREDANQIKNLLPGIGNERANALAYVKSTDPKVFQDVVKAYFLGGGLEEENKNKEENDLASLLKQLQGSSQESQEPLQQLNVPQRQSFTDQIQKATLQNTLGTGSSLGNQAQLNDLLSILQQKPQQSVAQPQVQQHAQQPQQKQSFNQIIQKGLQNPEDRRHQERLLQKSEQNKEANKIARFKATKDIREKAFNIEKAADDNLQRLKEFEALERTGKIDSPQYLAALRRLGINEEFLKNPETTAAEKIVRSFFRNIKDVFGGRILEVEIEEFLKTLPNLNQTPEGRKLVIDSLKNYFEGEKIIAQELRKIKKEYGENYPPLDLDEILSERVGERREKLTNSFIENLEKSRSLANQKELSFSSIPPAKDFPEETELDAPDGKVLINRKVNGKLTWVEKGK